MGTLWPRPAEAAEAIGLGRSAFYANVLPELRRLLLEHRLLTGRVSGGLVVEKAGGGVESGDSLAWRAEKAWGPRSLSA
jgi:hypothetical protein